MAYLEVPIWTPLFLLRRRLRQAVDWSISYVNSQSSFKIILDVGCGTMPYRPLALKYNSEAIYEGADILESEKIKYTIDIQSQTINGVNDNYADLVVSFEVLEHVQQTHEFLAELYRVCKTGGFLILSVPFMFEFHPCPGDYYRFTKQGLISVVEQSGFKVDHIAPIGSEFDAIAVALQLSLSRRFGYTITKPIFLFTNMLALLSDYFFKVDKERVIFNLNYIVIARKLP